MNKKVYEALPLYITLCTDLILQLRTGSNRFITAHA